MLSVKPLTSQDVRNRLAKQMLPVRFAAQKVTVQVTPPLPKPSTPEAFAAYFERQLVAILPEQRRAAVDELKQLPDKTKLYVINQLAAHPNEMIRGGVAKAVQSLSKSLHKEKDRLIAQFIRDSHHFVQIQGVRALPEISDRRLLQQLVSELKPSLATLSQNKQIRYPEKDYMDALTRAIEDVSPKGRLKSLARKALVYLKDCLEQGIAKLS